ncbi:MULTISPECIES: hypothetical protein [Streptomyces]|uniref:hypothetical protein n=1 Tax=Streptomyces TaxID=1883 RepID=UPI001963E206|nr:MULTISPECIES: hypothetical protein [Streptomyces]QRX90519.1 hypothetical protein JNO44_06415 [Streptomyces noursei]UJB40451.1 hypothetical protein HRD51_06010 [Streptomyces sp. A1-5]
MGSTTPPGESPAADPLTRFQSIVQDVLDSAEHSCGVEVLETDLERALELLRSTPDRQPQFEAELVALIDSMREGVVELVSFVMHELRWPAVEEAISRRISAPLRDVSHLRLYEAMLEAFSDSWRDRDLYARFEAEERREP